MVEKDELSEEKSATTDGDEQIPSRSSDGEDADAVVRNVDAKLSSQSVLKDDRDLFWACIAVVTLMTARLIHTVILHPLRIGWDPALHLQAAQLITQGKIPYVDMFDAHSKENTCVVLHGTS